MLADMQARTDAARLLLYRVGELIDEGGTDPTLDPHERARRS